MNSGWMSAQSSCSRLRQREAPLDRAHRRAADTAPRTRSARAAAGRARAARAGSSCRCAAGRRRTTARRRARRRSRASVRHASCSRSHVCEHAQHFAAREHAAEQVQLRLGVDRASMPLVRLGPTRPLGLAEIVAGRWSHGAMASSSSASRLDDVPGSPTASPNRFEPADPVGMHQVLRPHVHQERPYDGGAPSCEDRARMIARLRQGPTCGSCSGCSGALGSTARDRVVGAHRAAQCAACRVRRRDGCDGVGGRAPRFARVPAHGDRRDVHRDAGSRTDPRRAVIEPRRQGLGIPPRSLDARVRRAARASVISRTPSLPTSCRRRANSIWVSRVPASSSRCRTSAAGSRCSAGASRRCCCCSRYRWWAPLLLAAAWGSTHHFLKAAAIWHARMSDDTVEKQRRAGYAYRLTVESPAAKEVRLFGLADWIVGGFTSLRRQLLDRSWADRKMGARDDRLCARHRHRGQRRCSSGRWVVTRSTGGCRWDRS